MKKLTKSDFKFENFGKFYKIEFKNPITGTVLFGVARKILSKKIINSNKPKDSDLRKIHMSCLNFSFCNR